MRKMRYIVVWAKDMPKYGAEKMYEVESEIVLFVEDEQKAGKEWAKKLNPEDMGGFYTNANGDLILTDECGNYAYPPNGVFEVVEVEE